MLEKVIDAAPPAPTVVVAIESNAVKFPDVDEAIIPKIGLIKKDLQSP